MTLPKYLAYIVTLCFERQYRKQNGVVRVNQTFCPHQFWPGYAIDTEPIEDRRSRSIVKDYFSHNSPVDRDREVFKLSEDAEVF